MRPAGAFVGLATLDAVYRVTEPPAADRKLVASGQELAAGGPAANAAVTYAALGGQAMLVTALGRHPLASHVAGELASRGVRVLDAAPDRVEPPAMSSVWVVDRTGARSVVSMNDAGAEIAAPPGLAGTVGEAAVLLVDGHHPALALAAARAARSAGCPVLLDGGSWKPVLDDLLPLVDVAAVSADFRVPGTSTAAGSAAALRDRYGVPAVATTAGPDPVHWTWIPRPGHHPAGRDAGASSRWTGAGRDAGASSWGAGRGPGVGAEGEIVAGAVPVPLVAARDTLGAGDAFHGALAWALATRPAALDTAPGFAGALAFAAEIAAVRVTVAGPRRWLADPRLAALAAAWPAAGR